MLKASPLAIYAAMGAPKGAELHRRWVKPYHAFLNVQAACLQQFCQARHQVPPLRGAEVVQGVEVQILGQVAGHCIKGV